MYTAPRKRVVWWYKCRFESCPDYKKNSMEKRIAYLESLVPKDVDIDKLFFINYAKFATYMGNGVYSYRGIHSTDTRELFLMSSLQQLKIEYKKV